MIANLCFQTSTKTNTNSFRVEIQTTVCKIGLGFDGLLSYMLTLEPCFTLFGDIDGLQLEMIFAGKLTAQITLEKK